MTNVEKNIAIAEMLGATVENWYPPNKEAKTTGNYLAFQTGQWWPNNTKCHRDSLLKFDTDANWQFEAINWIESQLMFVDKLYYAQITKLHCGIYSEEHILNKYRTKKGFKSWTYYCNISSYGATKKEAIFEALYQFSIYLKQLK